MVNLQFIKMGQTRKNLLPNRSRYSSKIKLDNSSLNHYNYGHESYKKKIIKGVIYDNRYA
jgi:hypothetical protein